jgi:hypothetical protein
MQRIDSENAPPNENGTGKPGFSGNDSLPGQDATYLTPAWLNSVQEEMANLLELRSIELNPEDKRQLFDALAGKDDLADLEEVLQEQFDGKYNKTGGTISGNVGVTGNVELTGTLTTNTLIVAGESNTTQISHDSVGGVDRTVLSTTNDRLFIDKPLFNGSWSAATDGYTTLPNGFILQFGFMPYANRIGDLPGTTTGEKVFTLTFPLAFPTACLSLTTTIAIAELEIENDTWIQVHGVTSTGATLLNQTTNSESSEQQPFLGIYWQAIGR